MVSLTAGLKITSLDKIKSGEWLVLAQMGEEPIRDLPNSNNIPTIPMMAKTAEQRELLRFGIAAPNQFGKIYVLPPGAPQDRAAALEAAFTKTFEDKEFLAEADKGRLEIDPVSAQQRARTHHRFNGYVTDGENPATEDAPTRKEMKKILAVVAPGPLVSPRAAMLYRRCIRGSIRL